MMPDRTVSWVKSAKSGLQECVEVAFLGNGTVLVRDSKNPHEPPLRFDKNEWNAFLEGVKAGDFDDIA
jgi:Domain of unknown function (DUF397)